MKWDNMYRILFFTVGCLSYAAISYAAENDGSQIEPDSMRTAIKRVVKRPLQEVLSPGQLERDDNPPKFARVEDQENQETPKIVPEIPQSDDKQREPMRDDDQDITAPHQVSQDIHQSIEDCYCGKKRWDDLKVSDWTPHSCKSD